MGPHVPGIHARQHTGTGGIQHRARGEHRVPCSHVVGNRPNGVTGAHRLVDGDSIRRRLLAIFHHHHGIGAIGHRRTGHDAQCFACLHAPFGAIPGGNRADHPQSRWHVRHVARAHRKAVDCRVRKRRDVLRCHHITGQDEPCSPFACDDLLGQWRHCGKYPLLRIAERDHL